ncbi:MAG TPA: hypothetical protein VHF47_09880 [Acidimicrobiales bacterium]|nr:hypothetical protein [Acidimicrobiales bacterium]
MQLRRRLIGVLALLCVLAMPGTVAATPGITAVGTVDRFPQEATERLGPSFTGDGFLTRFSGGTLLPVPGAGQLWQVYPEDSGRRTGVLVRDASSRQVIGSFVIDTELRRATVHASGGGEWLHVTDGGHRVFVLGYPSRLLEIDASTFTLRDHGRLTALPVEAPFQDPLLPASLTYDASTGGLLVLYGGIAASVANRLTVVQHVDLATGARRSRIVRACTGPLPGTDFSSSTAAPEVLLRPDAVYVTCQTTGLSLLPGGARGLVVRLPRAGLFERDGEESSVPAGGLVDTALVDPHSGRILVVGYFGEVTVVDAGAMSVVGTFRPAVGAEPRIGPGLDRRRGRFYFQSDLGFGYVDIRSTPLSVPVGDSSAADDGQERIVPDGSRVYVLPGTAYPGDSKAARYTIYSVAP